MFAAKFELSSLNIKIFFTALWEQNGSVADDSESPRNEDGRPKAEKLYFHTCDHGFPAHARSEYGTGLSDSPEIDRGTLICRE